MARIALYEHGLRDVVAKSLDLDWAELVELLTSHESHCSVEDCLGRDCPAKDASAWSPVDIDGPRADANVRAVTCFVADLDHCALSTDEILAAVEGYACVLHSTHSHSAKDACYRLAVPLTRPATAAEWPRVRRAIVAALGLPADPSCRDRSRLYFVPTSRRGAPVVALSRAGEALDVDEALALAGEEPAAPALPAVAAPEPVELGTLRGELQAVRYAKSHGDAYKREQADVLGRVLEGKALAEQGARDNTVLRACGLLARHLPAETAWEAALEILRPALSAMDCAPEGLEAWVEIARVKYERAAAARRVQDGRRAAERAAAREVVRAVAGRAVPTAAEVAQAGGDWEELLLVNKQGIRTCEHNAVTLISCAPELRGTLRWDDFAKRPVVVGGPLAGVPPSSIDTALAAWLQRNYEFMGSSSLVAASAALVARQNPYDSLSEYLSELAWDGEPRLDRFLSDYLGCEATPYVRAVSRRWLISLAARAVSPGCQVDTVLILEGPQGAGKSSALRTLVGHDKFLDTALELGDRDTMQAIASVWLVELGELASMSRAEAAKVKQFVTSRVDKFRPPYGRVVEEFARRCVLVGTTNDEDYLTDRAGNRRYWPVKVGRIDLPALRRDRENLLAEAVTAFNRGERWWLVGDELSTAEAETEGRLAESALAERVVRWWRGLSPGQRPPRVAMVDVAEALQLPLDRLDRRTRTEIGWAMGRMGFRRERRADAGGRVVRYYVPSDELLRLPQETSLQRARHLAVVAAATGKPQQ